MARYTFFPGDVIGNAHRIGHGNIGGWGEHGIQAVSTTAALPIGTLRRGEDGRKWRYAHFVSAVGPGKLVAQDVSVSAVVEVTGDLTADEAIGQTVISITSSENIGTDDAANVYAGGYLHVNDDAGEGHTYRIKSSTQGTAGGVVELTLWDPILIQVNTESSVSITGFKWKNCAINNHNVDAIVAGVTMADMAAAEYGWVQTAGIGTVLGDESAGTIGLGTIAQVSDNVDGAAQPFGGGATNSEDDHLYDTSPIIGNFAQVGVDTEYVAVDLRLE